MVHVYKPEYGESGFSVPCPVCGYEYDRGNHYLQRPCPACGAVELEASSLQELMKIVVRHLYRKWKVRTPELADAIGVKRDTLLRWTKQGCGPSQFQQFAKGVRKLREEGLLGRPYKPSKKMRFYLEYRKLEFEEET